MNQTYAIKVSDTQVAIADLHPHMGGWRIARISVPPLYRGKGYGTHLLLAICADADAEGTVLYLEPQSSGGLTQTQLTAWYQRYHFEWDTEYLPRSKRTYTQHHGGMVRYPQ